MVSDHVAVADASERQLLDRFTGHPVLARIESLPADAFLAMLLQRRFLSLIFAPVYDIAIDALQDAKTIRLVRQILREEYPGRLGTQPSHREELVRDLIALGASRTQILTCRPTPTTSSVLHDTLEIIATAACDADDLRVITFVRFWGEVLVAVEYGEYWKRMAPDFKQAGVRSRFYLEHYRHDGRVALAQASRLSPTHSGRLGTCLKRRLTVPEAEQSFAEIEQRVVDIRLRFYDQFADALPTHSEPADGASLRPTHRHVAA